MSDFNFHHILCAFTQQGLQTIYADPDIPARILREAEPYCMPSGQACLLPEPIPPALGYVPLADGYFLVFRILPSPRGRHARGALLFGHGLVGDAAAYSALGDDPAKLLYFAERLFIADDSLYISGAAPSPVLTTELLNWPFPEPQQAFTQLLQAGFSVDIAVALLSMLLGGTRHALVDTDSQLDRAILAIYRLLRGLKSNGTKSNANLYHDSTLII